MVRDMDILARLLHYESMDVVTPAFSLAFQRCPLKFTLQTSNSFYEHVLWLFNFVIAD